MSILINSIGANSYNTAAIEIRAGDVKEERGITTQWILRNLPSTRNKTSLTKLSTRKDYLDATWSLAALRDVEIHTEITP